MKKETWKPSLILGGTTTALGFARSLARKGVPVTLMSASPAQPAMHSRRAERILVPHPVRHPDECRAEILEWGRRNAGSSQGKCVLIPTLEEYVRIVSEHRDEMSEFFLFRLPPASLAAQLIDKRSQYRLMENLGLNVPATVSSEREDFIEATTEHIGFPCVLKPCESHLWRQVRGRFKALQVNSPRELEIEWNRLGQLGHEFLAQEAIPGNDDRLYSYLGYYNEAGRPLGDLTVRKLRQQPAGYGSGSLVESIDEPGLYRISRRALEEIGYAGHLDMEYKLDPRDDAWKLIEVNIRGTAFIQLAVSSGVDLPWIGYLDTGYLRTSAPAARKTGVRFINSGWDLQAVLSTPDGGIPSLAAWILDLRKVRAFALLNLWDIKPIIWELTEYIRKLTGRFRNIDPE